MFGLAVNCTSGDLLLFGYRPKKPKEKKGDTQLGSPSLRYGGTCTAREKRGSVQTRLSPQTAPGPDPVFPGHRRPSQNGRGKKNKRQEAEQPSALSKPWQFANTDAGTAALIANLAPRQGSVAAAVALCLADYPVMVVNPRQAHGFTKALGFSNKTDKTDAQALAQFVHTLYSSVKRDKRDKLLMKLATREQERLAAMVTRRAQLVGMRVAEGNRLAGNHRTHRKSIEAMLKAVDRQTQALDADIGGQLIEHFKGKPDLLKGMKGVGAAPLNRDRGTMKGRRTTCGRRADVRSALYMDCQSAVRYDPVVKAFYQHLRAAGKPAEVALVACMHKLLTIINAVIKSGKPWQAGCGCPQAAQV